ncbi:crooked legs [Carabus blaptoides fortunei]
MIEFAKICRLCISDTNSTFNVLSVDEDSVTLGDKLKTVCDIQINVNDCMPTAICSICQTKLRQFYEFKLMCLHSNVLLSKYKKDLTGSSSVLRDLRKQIAPSFPNVEIKLEVIENVDDEVATSVVLERTATNDSQNVIPQQQNSGEDRFTDNDDDLAETSLELHVEEADDEIINWAQSKHSFSQSQSTSSNKELNFEAVHVKENNSNDYLMNDDQEDDNNDESVSENSDSNDEDYVPPETVADDGEYDFKWEKSLKGHMKLHTRTPEEMMELCNIQINPSDCLPTSICELCLDKIRQFYDFKLSCLHSSRQLSQYKKQLLSSSLKNKKSQKISVRSIKDLSQDTNLIQNCITDQLKQVTSVQQHHSVQDESSQLVKINLLAAQLSDNDDDVASYNNDDDNAGTMSDDDDTNIEDSVTNNSVKQITSEDPLLMDGVTVNTVKVESKTEEKFARIDVEMYVEKIEDEWMKWENEQHSKTVDSAKSANTSVDDTNDHKANEEDSESNKDRSPVVDGPKEYDSYFCHTCNKHFTNKSSVSSHKRYHIQHEANYQCDRCGKQFKLKASYQKHMLRYSGKRPYKCDICNKTFTDKVYLYSHSKKHSDARPYQCEICGKTFKYARYVRVHKSSHTGEKPFACSTCGKAFGMKVTLNAHRRTHTDLRSFKCKTCDKCFPNIWALRKHNIVHTTERKYQCDICQMCFKRPTNLKEHKRIHSRDPDETKPCNFACEVCGKLLRSRDSLMKHAGVHSEERPFKCELCGKCFKYKSCWTSHQQINHEGKSVECKVCGKTCTTKNGLARHMELHTGEKSQKCELCDKCFPNIWALKKHNIVHTTERKYQCDICQMWFKRPASLKEHKRIHSRDPNDIKPCNFACEVCGKLLRSKDSLMKHAGVHSQERPFKCELCGKCFKYKSCWTSHQQINHEGKSVECKVCDPSSLRTHTVAHSNIKQHKCEYCGQEFKHRNNMMTHIKKKHSDLITKENKTNISQESDGQLTNDSAMEDNEEETSASILVNNEEETKMAENEMIIKE